MPALGPIAKSLVATALVLGAYACKGVPNPNSSDGNNGNGNGNGGNNNYSNNVATTTFLGTWSGIYKNSDTSAELRQTKATASFQATDNQSGTFRIDLPALNNVYVVGNYDLFGQSSMLLNIAQSTISTLGEPNTRVDINYTLLGKSLELHNDHVVLKLIRDDGPAPNGNGQPNAQLNNPNGGNQDPSFGKWRCTDHLGQLWQTNLLPTNIFTIEVSDPKRELGLVWLQGPLTIAKAGNVATVNMTVQDADQTKYEGMQLSATLQTNGQLRLSRLGANGEDMSCDRG